MEQYGVRPATADPGDFELPPGEIDPNDPTLHAARALMLGDRLGVVFVYDPELRTALAAEGLRVAAPASP